MGWPILYGRRDQHDGFTVLNQAGPLCEACHAADFQYEGSSRELTFDSCRHFLFSSSHRDPVAEVGWANDELVASTLVAEPLAKASISGAVLGL